MKKLLLILLISPLLIFAQGKQTGFVINGKLDGFAEGTKIQLYKNGENVEMTSTKLVKGKFLLKGKLVEPTLCYLAVGKDDANANANKPVEIYLENAVISFKGKKSQPMIYEIAGSTSHKEFTAFTAAFIPKAQQLNNLSQTINGTMQGTERDMLINNYTSIQQSMQTDIEKFVKDKPRSVVSAFILNVTYQFNEDITTLENRFNSLDAAVKKSQAGKQLQSFIDEKKIGAIGTQAIDFTQPDTSGKAVSLSSFKGKYVLVDFWASWCGPCRSENPNVVENYNRFNAKNFTVLGVSLDRQGGKERWLEAIKADNLTWNHVSDLQFWNNAAAKLYGVTGIPYNFLVDPTGKIIAKNLRGPALQAKLCEVLGCN
jgi:peroxiredoxin